MSRRSSIDLNQLGGLRRHRFVGRGHCRNFVANMQHGIFGQKWLVDADFDASGIFRRNDCLDTRKRSGFGDVNVFDPCVRMRTADNLAGQHSWQTNIVGIQGTAGNLVDAIEARPVFADDA